MIGIVLHDDEIETYLETLFSTLDALISLKKIFKDSYSPFGNTGPIFIKTPVFTAVGYDWGANDSEDEKDWQPYNFKYRDKLTVSWYKHAWRGLEISSNETITDQFMLKMYEDCINSVLNDKYEYGYVYDGNFSY